MARMRRLRARLGPVDSAARFRSLGVDVFLGDGRFTGPDALEVGGRTLRFVRAAVCTGARPAVPDVPGLRAAGYLTSETVFSLTELPVRLAVVGGGPIGCELAQCFARCGSRVALIERSGRILPREEADAAEIVARRLAADGVELLLDGRLARVDRSETGATLFIERTGATDSRVVDQILVAVGRVPNVAGIGLEAAGVAFDERRGVHVDDHLRTTNPRIYAAGDVCSPYQFTHAADAQAKVLVQNALFPHPLGLGRARASRLVIPWCTYTEPEVAQVGLLEDESHVPVDVFTVPLAEVDRAVLDGQEEGYARVVLRKGTDRILGATVVAAHAGELISLFSLLMTARRGLSAAGSTVFPYPTQAEAIKKLASMWRRSGFRSFAKALLTRFFTWRR
jgi:pyruvate/2-oxoglutarate dehydrogenase complex dihydrolipoamide dehydrogenase (E3) component